MRCATNPFISSFETMPSKVKFDLLSNVSLVLLLMFIYRILPVKAFDDGKNPGGLSLIFNPPIVKKARASEEANFTVEFVCNQQNKESQINCQW